MRSRPFPDINWLSLSRRLTARAVGLFRAQELSGNEGVLKGLGKSAEDFATEALAELLKDIHKYDADTEGKCFALASTILRHRYTDAVSKAHAYLKAKDVDEQTSLGVAGRATPASKEVDAWDLAKKYHALAGGDAELVEIIDAIAVIATEQRADIQADDIASLLGIPIKEARRKIARLDYRIKTSAERYAKIGL